MLLNKLTHCFNPTRMQQEAAPQKPVQSQQVVDLKAARQEALPKSSDVKLEHNVLYETNDIKGVLQRLSKKSHPPIWLMLHKDTGDQAQNTPDRVLRLHHDPKQGVVAHFTDFEGDQEVVLGKYSSKTKHLDQLAQKIHERIGYARFFLDASPMQKGRADDLDEKIGLMSEGSTMKVSLSPPGLPGLKLPGPPPTPTVSPHEIQLTGAARWPNKALDKSDTPANKAYSQSMWDHSRTAGGHIKEGKIGSYRQLWTRASEWRLSTTASKASDGEAMNFISPRNTKREQNTPYVTRLHTNGPYEYFYDKVKVKTAETFGGQAFQGEDVGNINGKDIPLNNYMLSNRDESSDGTRHGVIGVIQHTHGMEINDIMNHVESLFRQTLTDDMTPQEQLSHIAEAHWWVCNACPDFRGSAAKAEFCARAMGEACGIELPPFKDGILPDLEAMAMSKDDFVSHYANLLERLPTALEHTEASSSPQPEASSNSNEPSLKEHIEAGSYKANSLASLLRQEMNQ